MKGPTLDPRITAAVDYLQRHLDEPITMSTLARRVNLSPSRFRYLFAWQTGMAPAPYLRRLRLRRARLLIERTFLNVKEVMALVGYNDPSHFTREFRRMHGAAPRALRASGAATPMPHVAGAVAIVHDAPRQANSPTLRRIGQVKRRAPTRRCA